MSGVAPAVLVSACLLGVECNHRGQGSRSGAVAALAEKYRLIPVCPEVAGGLPTPRPAAERRRDGKVVTAEGVDVTEHYQRGADQAVKLARASGADMAVLKARSPSCGSREVYDGSHRGVLVSGEGVTAEALRAVGVRVVSEEDL
jgi:uncharacterized protein YbbK (DUF523 family)